MCLHLMKKLAIVGLWKFYIMVELIPDEARWSKNCFAKSHIFFCADWPHKCFAWIHLINILLELAHLNFTDGEFSAVSSHFCNSWVLKIYQLSWCYLIFELHNSIFTGIAKSGLLWYFIQFAEYTKYAIIFKQ